MRVRDPHVSEDAACQRAPSSPANRRRSDRFHVRRASVTPVGGGGALTQVRAVPVTSLDQVVAHSYKAMKARACAVIHPIAHARSDL
jgi:hypothetical protein